MWACNFLSFSPIPDHIYESLEFADKDSDVRYRRDTVIYNPQIIKDIVKICGCRFKIVPRPDEAVEEEEVSNLICKC